jgi:hypothetical protein
MRGSPGARAYYQALRERGTGHQAALRQLGNRLVGILHGCLKTKVARTVLGQATTPESLAAGAWSTAYALTVAGRAMVLRVSRYGGDFAKDEAVSAVVGGMLRVPAITARGETHGWAYAVSERLTGTPLDDLDPSALAAVLPDLFDVMDAIGRIDVSGRGYGVWGSVSNGSIPLLAGVPARDRTRDAARTGLAGRSGRVGHRSGAVRAGPGHAAPGSRRTCRTSAA